MEKLNRILTKTKTDQMDAEQIECLADEVRKVMLDTLPPVDVIQIAKEEGILLAPGNYGEEFDGRIEYHRQQGKFIIFYPENTRNYPDSRTRFSIAHELGHYYLPAHRGLLLRGKIHNSKAGFLCNNQLEREADSFSGALLPPEDVLNDICFRRKFLTLKDILQLASDWKTSASCAAIRYVKYAAEPCAILLSENKQVRYYVPSEDAACRGFQYLGIRQVPAGTENDKANSNQGSGKIFESESDTQLWFSRRRANCTMWEESFPLGYTGLVLTMFAFDFEDDSN